MKITVGGRTGTLSLTPGHPPGTISGGFQVQDRGKPRAAFYSGGAESNCPNDVEHFDQYLASVRRQAQLARDAGATVIINNQSQFNGAADIERMTFAIPAIGQHAQLVGAEAVGRYFAIEDQCAQAQ